MEVNAAAALAEVSAAMRAKSVRPLFLRPAFAAPNLKPLGSRTWDASDMEVDPFNLTGELGSEVCGFPPIRQKKANGWGTKICGYRWQ